MSGLCKGTVWQHTNRLLCSATAPEPHLVQSCPHGQLQMVLAATVGPLRGPSFTAARVNSSCLGNIWGVPWRFWGRQCSVTPYCPSRRRTTEPTVGGAVSRIPKTTADVCPEKGASTNAARIVDEANGMGPASSACTCTPKARPSQCTGRVSLTHND